MKKAVLLLFVVLIFVAAALAQAEDEIQVSVTVEGTVFSLGLQDSAGAPWSGGELDFGTLSPGDSSKPGEAVIVAACQSNTTRQWYLNVSSSELKDLNTGHVIPSRFMSVGVGDPLAQGHPALPGIRHATTDAPKKLSAAEASIYSSNSEGDAGFDTGYGTYLPVIFSLTVPRTQKEGIYSGVIRFTMTE
ncbi:MAG: hypothetical protein ABIH39_00375 [Candidatus Margulisiibacteriota bacterium]